ncbi:dynein heavy chain 14, axonemal-like [Molossus molossus]|uniref:dynein heavy chain 14, axonemal-like n=1 Tax=Molossus molossus TaxID=27622 RepID=UPI001746B193|nr:dynein heavy chain 14, axonemal-like [Molossus molossus]
MATYIPIDSTTRNRDVSGEKSKAKPRRSEHEEQNYRYSLPSENQPAKATEKETLQYRTFSAPLKAGKKEEPTDDDVVRHIIRLREKLGWQTLPYRNLEYRSFKTTAQKIILKEPLKDDGEFVYCLPRENPEVFYNQYDLQVVSAHRARHCKEFWMVTASFVSKVTDSEGKSKQVELIPALEWLLERRCYCLLRQFKIFSNFR